MLLLLLLLLESESEPEPEPESVPEENDSEVSSEILPSGEQDKGHDAASFLATMSGIFFSHGFLIMLETGAWTTWTTASGP
jgi:hypothetical protein